MVAALVLCGLLFLGICSGGGLDPYTVLQLPKHSTQDEIRKQYRRLSMQYHPDKNPDPNAAVQFAALVEAYEILGDADRRAIHDDLGGETYQSRPQHFDSTKGFYSDSSLVTALDEANFDKLVFCVGVPKSECSGWMVEFYATWCVHCRNMIDHWKKAASQMDGYETDLGYIRFGGVNCETQRGLCQKLEVSSFPTIRFIAHSRDGHRHMEQFPSQPDRSAEKLVEFATMNARLAAESALISLDPQIFDIAVTNVDSEGPWLVLFESKPHPCRLCDVSKASMRRMSANLKGLAYFGIVDCSTYPQLCASQGVHGGQFPRLRMYSYKGAKGVGEDLFDPSIVDPQAVLPVVEKVIRLCIASLESETGVIKPPLKDEEKEDHEHPQPEHRDQPFEHPRPQISRQNFAQLPGQKAQSPTARIGN